MDTNNSIHYKVSVENTYPLPNFDGCVVEVWECGGMDKLFHPTLVMGIHNVNYVSMLGLKLIRVSKRSPSEQYAYVRASITTFAHPAWYVRASCTSWRWKWPEGPDLSELVLCGGPVTPTPRCRAQRGSDRNLPLGVRWVRHKNVSHGIIL